MNCRSGNQLCLTVQLTLTQNPTFEASDVFEFYNQQSNGSPGNYEFAVNFDSGMTDAGETIPIV